MTKEKIINLLKKEGKSSTSKIKGILRLDYFYVLNILQELEKEKILKKTKEGKFTYWEIVILKVGVSKN